MRRSGMKKKVLAYFEAGLSNREIAELLGCHSAYVRATLARAGLTPSVAEYRLAQIRQRLADLAEERAKILRRRKRYAAERRAA
jgi:uncharacterized metal-binding protein